MCGHQSREELRQSKVRHGSSGKEEKSYVGEDDG
jgi:hypothetical protein